VRATARERAGLLLDRATRAVTDRTDRGRLALERSERRLGAVLPARLARDRALLARGARVLPLAIRGRVTSARGAVAAGAAALAALGPQATLARGYAIVRRADGAIVRAPFDAPGGTRLRLRLARGEIGATSDGADSVIDDA
jgi:exodeoxyribonuclease VII large subunit